MRDTTKAKSTSISIHALREEGDLRPRITVIQLYAFLSTPSARRATVWRGISRARRGYFYPRPPRGGRPLFFTSYLEK